MPREGECIASGRSSFQPLTVRGKNVLTIVSVVSAAAETLVLHAAIASVVSAAAETLVVQAVRASSFLPSLWFQVWAPHTFFSSGYFVEHGEPGVSASVF